MAYGLIKPGSLWEYKGKAYLVKEVRENLLIQDPLGNWVASVIYESSGVLDKEFSRSVTEFMSKFKPWQ